MNGQKNELPQWCTWYRRCLHEVYCYFVQKARVWRSMNNQKTRSSPKISTLFDEMRTVELEMRFTLMSIVFGTCRETLRNYKAFKYWLNYFDPIVYFCHKMSVMITIDGSMEQNHTFCPKTKSHRYCMFPGVCFSKDLSNYARTKTWFIPIFFCRVLFKVDIFRVLRNKR